VADKLICGAAQSASQRKWRTKTSGGQKGAAFNVAKIFEVKLPYFAM